VAIGRFEAKTARNRAKTIVTHNVAPLDRSLRSKKLRRNSMSQNVLKDVSSSSILNEEGKPTEQDKPREGGFTRRLEQQTAKVPSGGYLGLAIGSMLLSAGVAVFAQKKEYANFIGLWAPSLLLIGIYNKLVKQLGSN
jgi:hypothetical protein